MAEGAALFDPGFLGTVCLVDGQVADDSEWRDNILPGKFEDANSIPGWGRRYKVRIMGIHDKEEESIPSDQLPWASVMYPITAGGGQTGASQTPMIRQGNFVFGFFMDGQDQQVPVIMGIMGHNAQTPMTIKLVRLNLTLVLPVDMLKERDQQTGNAKPIAPDDGLVIKKPTDPKLALHLLLHLQEFNLINLD